MQKHRWSFLNCREATLAVDFGAVLLSVGCARGSLMVRPPFRGAQLTPLVTRSDHD